MSSDEYKIITEVPARLKGEKAITLAWLLKNSDKAWILERPKGKSLYKFYFDDGAYKGGYEIHFKQIELTPLHAYIRTSETGWLGFKKNIDVIQQFCLDLMSKE